MLDEDKQESFDLRALLFITINDWPALSNLSGQTNKGYRACTHCLDKTEAIHLKIFKKVVYMGNRCFLPANHPLRKKGMHWKGKADHHTKPSHSNGEEIFEMVKDLRVVFGKGDGSQLVPNDTNGRAPMWKMKSIFWELPYWQILEVRNTIDVMHLTKNLYVNVLGFMGCYGNLKDTLEARRDVKDIHRNEQDSKEVDGE